MRWTTLLAVAALAGAVNLGCASSERKDEGFHTSGNRAADQRAEQRIAKAQQLRGAGQDDSDEQTKKSLYERLGGQEGISTIVGDFVSRALADPRVNWERKGIESGGVLGIGATSQYWKPTEQNIATLKKHLTQFFALATGGPAKYEGKEMKQAHAGMKITNAEFDAAVGDLKASLDALGVPTDEQKELIAIVESTRPQIAEER